jgi:hypothetical protein
MARRFRENAGYVSGHNVYQQLDLVIVQLDLTMPKLYCNPAPWRHSRLDKQKLPLNILYKLIAMQPYDDLLLID